MVGISGTLVVPRPSCACLAWLLPSLQFIAQSSHQIPLRWSSSVLSLGPGQGHSGRMTKCSPYTWSVVPMPALPCRRSVSGRNVHSCQVRANRKRSLKLYREEDSWLTASSPSGSERQPQVSVASADPLLLPLSYLYCVPARAVLSTQTFKPFLLQRRCSLLRDHTSLRPW